MLDTLSAVVKQCNFQDAKNTSKDPCLLGPPSLEFAPYGKNPSSRNRKDGRQGTIDQDPDFIDFLHSLTEPMSRPSVTGEGIEAADAKSAKVTTTPLVEYLKEIKEKKANKSKEGAVLKMSKSQGKQEAKEIRADKADPKNVSVVRKEALRSPERAKAEKATQDAVKVVDNSVAALKGKSETSESAVDSSKAPATKPTTVERERERKRGSASIAAKILRRDLGLAPERPDRKASRSAHPAPKGAAAGAESEREIVAPSPVNLSSAKAPEATTSAVPSEPSPSLLSAPVATPTGPRITKTPMPSPQPVKRPVSTLPVRTSRPPPTPSQGARSAFLKHANYSQGVTEELLHSAFSSFGEVTHCEIDRKKGFGYVHFKDTNSLEKAMLASPIQVGDKGGQVVVLENKNVKSKHQHPATQATQTSREGGAPVEPQPPSTMSSRHGVLGDTPTISAGTAAPTAPRGANVTFRGAGRHHSPRGGYIGPPRGAFTRTGRGGRANLRGRGAFESSRGAGHANSKGNSGTLPTMPTAPPTLAPISTPDVNTNEPAG